MSPTTKSEALKGFTVLEIAAALAAAIACPTA